MFSETLLTFPSTANYSLGNTIERVLKQTLILLSLALFLYSKTIFTSVLLISAIIYHQIMLKLNPKYKLDIRTLTNSQSDFKVSFENKERYITRFLVIYVSVIFAIKAAKNIMNSFFKQPGWTFLKTKLEVLSTFIFSDLRKSKEDIYAGGLILLLGLVLFVITEKSEVYYDRPLLKIMRIMNGKIFTRILYGIVSILIMIKVLWYRSWSIFKLLESLAIVVIMIICFMRYQLTGIFRMTEYLNYHKYVCLFKLVLIAVFIMLKSLELTKWISVIGKSFIEEMNKLEEPWNLELLLVMLLFVFHSALNFALKFKQRLVDPTAQSVDTNLKTKPYKLMLINYFAKNLIPILGQKKFENCLKINLDLKFNFYKALKNHVHFRKQFEYSVRAYFADRPLSWKFELMSVLMKLGLVIKAYQFDIIRNGLNAVMILYLSMFFEQINILSVFYLITSLVILTHNSFKTISQAVFVFGIAPSFAIIILLGFAHFVKFSGPKNWALFLEKLVIGGGFDFDGESIKMFLEKKTSFVAIAVLYLILLSYINSKTENQRGVSLVEYMRRKRLKVLNTDEDVIFIGKKLMLVICYIMKWVLLWGIIMEFLNFVNILNSLLLVFVGVHCFVPSQKSYELFCEIALLVFVCRFLTRYVKQMLTNPTKYNFLFGYFYNDTLGYGSYDLWSVCDSKNNKVFGRRKR